MASLISRFTGLFRRQAPPLAPTTTLEMPPPPRPTAELNKFQIERDRRAIVEICRRMVDEDPRAEGVIATLARDATRGGFSVKVKRGRGTAQAQQEAADLIERLGLVELITDWAKLSFKDGDSFLEASVDTSGDIVKVSRKPTLQLHRNSDEFDVFPDPTRAYWWADELWTGQDAPQDATWFADWQIVHARWAHDEGSRYGRPLFASGRKAWKRIDEGELDIAVRRKTRAGLKYNHKFPDGTDAPAIEAYKEQNQDALENPTAAIADFFGTVDIEAIEGDGRLGDITDVMHHIRTWWVASPVPMSLLGYGQDLNRDVLQEQKKQYDRALDAIASWIDKDIIQPLIELQWRLKGIWPGALTYEIVRPSRNPLTASDLQAAGAAIASLKKSGLLVDELLLRFLAAILPGLDADEALKLLQEQQADQEARLAAMPPPPPPVPGVPPPNGPPPPPQKQEDA
jgi:hypothetical protein